MWIVFLFFVPNFEKNIGKVITLFYKKKSRSLYLKCNWIQKYNPKKISSHRKKITEYSCIQKDETVIKVGSEFIWL